MVFGKLRAFLRKRERNPREFTLASPSWEIEIVPPEQADKLTDNLTEAVEETGEREEEELCEDPKPLQTFHAVNPEVARERAAAKNLVVLYAGRERWDLWGRNRRIFWGIPQDFAVKILRLERDMKSETEFTAEEQAILKDLAFKRWVRILKNGGTYYYGLNRRTAIILQKQLLKCNHLD